MTPTESYAAATLSGATSVSPAEVPDFWFELPPGFTEFDLAEEPVSRALRMTEAIDAMFATATATAEQKLSLIASGEYILQSMITAGAEHVSSCLLRMPDGELSQGTLCVLVERPETGPQVQDRKGAARRTAAQWHSLYPDAEVGMVMLPYGIAALCIREQQLCVPGALFGQESAISTTVKQAQFCIPTKIGPGSVLFVFMTEDTRHWAEYLEVLSGIMKSVSQEEPGTEQLSGAGNPDAEGTER
ncbi:hypothetical protein ACIPSE_04965 [Streptomyces sp. NPDC090106]|uniref:hypothetical protein n=1 Tax=Streptomyces sp. NPDC090106 TaxID=3365946 RepID=UPI00380ECDDD